MVKFLWSIGIVVSALSVLACSGDASSETVATPATAVVPAFPTSEAMPTAVVAATALPEPTTVSVASQPPQVQATTAVQLPPAPTQVPTQPPLQAPAGPVTFNVTGKNLQYSTAQLSARSGAQVTVNFRNEDASVAHDLSFSIAGVGHGHTCFGPCSDTYTFTAPAPGRYDFFCTVHIEMAGALLVTP